MLFVSQKSDVLTKETIESMFKERYIQASDELFGYLANNDMEMLEKKIQELGFTKVTHLPKHTTTLYQHNSDISNISVLKTLDERYLLLLEYLDDRVILSDLSQEKYFQELNRLHYFILGDIAILVILFFLILTMLYPLKKISQKIRNFGEGKYKTRIDDIQSSDEIGEVAKSFNSMAENIDTLISARERLLRDIAHELKTPIAKSKIALEMLENSRYKNILQKANQQMEQMTDELLQIEKLRANRYELKKERFSSETLITEALSKLFLDNEDEITLQLHTSITIEADLFYLTIALKNLIDNALKYTTQKPIIIQVSDNTISVISYGAQLKKPLEYYTQSFTQEDSSRQTQGYGLGLSLVESILLKHHFKLHYRYRQQQNIFSIILRV